MLYAGQGILQLSCSHACLLLVLVLKLKTIGCVQVVIDGQVVQLSAGDSHTVALTEDGRVFAWGTFRHYTIKVLLLSPLQIRLLLDFYI